MVKRTHKALATIIMCLIMGIGVLHFESLGTIESQESLQGITFSAVAHVPLKAKPIRKTRRFIRNPDKPYIPKLGSESQFLENLRTSILNEVPVSGKSWSQEHIPERGGTPVKNLIITTWRSGSSFVGELLASHPGVLYFFEPLMFMDSVRVRNASQLEKALEMTESLFNCEFNHTEWEPVKYNYKHYFIRMMLRNAPKMTELCLQNRSPSCSDIDFMSAYCRLFPVQLFKFVRHQLKDVRSILERDDVRVLYLARDPRGTMKSRMTSSYYWCKDHEDCISAQKLCLDMEEDYQEALWLNQEFPGKFMAIRYEDIATDIIPAAEKVLNFFRLGMHPNVMEFVRNHTNQDGNYEFGTFRKTKETAFKWIEYYTTKKKFDVLRVIEDVCDEAIESWGYEGIDFAKLEGKASTNYTIGLSPLVI